MSSINKIDSVKLRTKSRDMHTKFQGANQQPKVEKGTFQSGNILTISSKATKKLSTANKRLQHSEAEKDNTFSQA